MKFLPFSAFLPDADWLAQHPNILQNALTSFPDFFKAGIYQKQSHPAYYILRMTSKRNGIMRYGLGGLTKTKYYGHGKNNINPHEKTLKAREQTQMDVYRSSKHLIKPILLTCPEFDELQGAMEEYCNDRISDLIYEPLVGLQIEIFVAGVDDFFNQQSLFDKIPSPVAVADGHHRISTAQLLMEEIPGLQLIPVVLIPANSLGIASFIRSVNTAGSNVKLEDFGKFFAWESISRTDAVLPSERGNWLLFNSNGIYKLTAENNSDLTDPEWFDQAVLPEIFDIQDSTDDTRLTITAADNGIDSLLELVGQRTDWHFLPPPVNGNDFFAKIKKQEVFPPKSTRFFPRIPSGLLVYEFC